ncbi:hypothetical protein [Bradyrhizobium sp. ORS 285]|uniref:hypothetical protein n=1 Tax=Bradyrhizobium sp. ORS 285 TaxID=115808 RepID=UPI00111254DF|nr:hypothetical protein [Bradyrhizobium sp. ORS 285]
MIALDTSGKSGAFCHRQKIIEPAPRIRQRAFYLAKRGIRAAVIEIGKPDRRISIKFDTSGKSLAYCQHRNFRNHCPRSPRRNSHGLFFAVRDCSGIVSLRPPATVRLLII